MKSYMHFATASPTALRSATVMSIDSSISMEEDDWKPSRLKAAQKAAKALIDEKCLQCPADYVGVVSFGGRAEVEHPLVPVGGNAASLIACLDKIRVKSATNIEAGLKYAAALLDGSSANMHGSGLWGLFENLLLGKPEISPCPVDCDVKQIICLSDGAPTSGNAKSCAMTIKESGVLIDCIGIASRDSVDEKTLKAVASLDEHGHPRYRFIGDEEALVKEFRRLAGHIKVMR